MENNCHNLIDTLDSNVINTISVFKINSIEFMLLDNSIASLPNTSPLTIHRLKSIGINTYWDLLNYFPFRYLDFSLISSIDKAQPGETITIFGKIVQAQNLYTRTGLKIQKVIITDPSGLIEASWYNQPYLIRLFKTGDQITIAGDVQKFGKKLVIQPQEYQIGSERVHVGRLVPVYPEKYGLSSRVIREKIYWLLEQINLIPELLPKKIISFNHLIDQLTAYKNIHFPDSHNLANQAKKRLAFDELFVIQLSTALTKAAWEKETVGNKFTSVKNGHVSFLQQFIDNLPFKLTGAQKRVWEEISNDLIKTKPMNRFLQGDVGSGKTVVAALACFLTYLNGFQSLFMVPTEILANQHYQTISALFKNYPLKIGLQTGSKKIENCSPRGEAGKLKIENYDIVIGTHALLNKNLQFKNVGLVIIDEQHRFGVSQRGLLKEKAAQSLTKKIPHLLTMTATPIPRTVALTLYGDLDLSYIDQMPRGRAPVKTFFVNSNKRAACYEWIKKEIQKKSVQIFIVCPLIEESVKETMKTVRAAEKEYQYLTNNVFKELKVGLVHGRIKSREKEKIMADFGNKKFDILIATPVVEVGIDISNATVMIVEAAERYGLAQLHQLRGRVGRGQEQSYCFLFTEKNDRNIIQRLQFFTKTNSGQKLAEYDLRHRGPGTIFGTKQHGYINLKIASLNNFQLINQTKSAVNYFISHYQINQYKLLNKQLKNFQASTVANN